MLKKHSNCVSCHHKAWITRPGKLGGEGFLTKASSTQKRLLTKCVKEHGYRSCLGSLMVLNRNRTIQRRHGRVIDGLKDWLKATYGGIGSYNPKLSKMTRRRRVRFMG